MEQDARTAECTRESCQAGSPERQLHFFDEMLDDPREGDNTLAPMQGPSNDRYTLFAPVMDSGASDNVVSGSVAPNIKIRPSAGSLRGQCYAAAGGKEIPNEGEVQEAMMTSEGVLTDTTWQIADVRNPLMAVSACNDKGNPCCFDSEGSYIISGTSPEIAQIRELIKKASKKINVERKGGTFKVKMWRIPPKLSEVFARRGGR